MEKNEAMETKSRRGGNHGGHKNSPVIGNNGISAAPGDIAKITREALEVGFLWPPIDNKDPEQLKQRAIEYFNYCIENDSRPGNMGLYSAWGIDRRTLYGQLAAQPDSDRTVIIKKSIDILSAIREKLMSAGKINPVTGIFWQKNYDGLKDVQELEITPKKTIEATQTVEQIEADIPIDIDD